MCIIIDANRSHLMHSREDKTFAPVYDWIKKRDGKLVYGGKLARELQLNDKTKRLLLQWNRAGKAILFQQKDLEPEESRLRASGLLRSNDAHRLALAVVSGARTIWTDDKDLRFDFTNVKVLSKPKGKLYDGPRHKDLLEHTKGCPGYVSQRKKRAAAETKKRKGRKESKKRSPADTDHV